MLVKQPRSLFLDLVDPSPLHKIHSTPVTVVWKKTLGIRKGSSCLKSIKAVSTCQEAWNTMAWPSPAPPATGRDHPNKVCLSKTDHESGITSTKICCQLGFEIKEPPIFFYWMSCNYFCGSTKYSGRGWRWGGGPGPCRERQRGQLGNLKSLQVGRADFAAGGMCSVLKVLSSADCSLMGNNLRYAYVLYEKRKALILHNLHIIFYIDCSPP